MSLACYRKSSGGHNVANRLLIVCERVVGPVNNVDKFPLFRWLPGTLYGFLNA
jgi:hypothetical protein